MGCPVNIHNYQYLCFKYKNIHKKMLTIFENIELNLYHSSSIKANQSGETKNEVAYNPDSRGFLFTSIVSLCRPTRFYPPKGDGPYFRGSLHNGEP